MKDHDPTKQELVELELRYWQAIVDRDADTARELAEDPCVVVGAQGATELNHDALATMMATARYQLESFQLDHVLMRRVSNDVYSLAYKVTVNLALGNEKRALTAFDSSVWTRRGKQWRCALHTESIAGDAFGRAAA